MYSSKVIFFISSCVIVIVNIPVVKAFTGGYPTSIISTITRRSQNYIPDYEIDTNKRSKLDNDNARNSRIGIGVGDKHRLFTSVVNGDNDSMIDNDISINATDTEPIPESPPLSFRKFLTMQEKRVVVTIIFTESSVLRSFFLTAAQRIKSAHPDVLIAKRVLPPRTQGQDNPSLELGVFEIQVDGKKIIGNGVNKKLSSCVGTAFIPMQELGLAVERARKRRRPATIYGGGGNVDDSKEGVRLEMLRRAKMEDSDDWDEYE